MWTFSTVSKYWNPASASSHASSAFLAVLATWAWCCCGTCLSLRAYTPLYIGSTVCCSVFDGEWKGCSVMGWCRLFKRVLSSVSFFASSRLALTFWSGVSKSLAFFVNAILSHIWGMRSPYSCFCCLVCSFTPGLSKYSMKVLCFPLPRNRSIFLKSSLSIVMPMWCFITISHIKWIRLPYEACFRSYTLNEVYLPKYPCFAP